MKLLGIINEGFDITDQLPFFIVTAVKTSNLTTTDHVFCIHQILEENGNIMRQYISYS
jgi:hypothetical protein